jgi:hypothetical protein
LASATELGEAEVDVQVIDDGLGIVRRLWDTGLALPSQLRRLLREQGRDLHAEFVKLLPSPPQPIRSSGGAPAGLGCGCLWRPCGCSPGQAL